MSLQTGTWCTFLTVGDLFGVAESTAHIIFQDVCIINYAHLILLPFYFNVNVSFILLLITLI